MTTKSRVADAPVTTPASATRKHHDFGDEVAQVLTQALDADNARRANTHQTAVIATEAQCQATIVEAARTAGWRVLAIRPGLNRRGHWATPIQGDAGYPDLTMVHARARRIIFAELKRHPNRLEDTQAAWGHALRLAGAEWRLIYVPDDLALFCQELADIDNEARTSK